MTRPAARAPRTPALRLARKAWQLLHRDSGLSATTAEQALTRALTTGDLAAQGWARLTCGYQLLYFATPEQAVTELAGAFRALDAAGDRAGAILAGTGRARCLWRQGQARDALEHVLPLRDEGLHLLKHDDRGMLLNTIAGCYSSLGQWEQAFAYLYQALRETSPTHGHGFEAALYCNLAHELLQLGDDHEALRHVDEGLARCARLNNLRLHGALLVNRAISLSGLGRAAEALPAIREVLALPSEAAGRATMSAHFESMAIVAMRAGDTALGAELIGHALQAAHTALPDEQLELAVARAELACLHDELPQALQHLQGAHALAQDRNERGHEHSNDRSNERRVDGISPRTRCLFFQCLADVQQQLGDHHAALASLRTWQRLHVERAQLASRARYQAAALQTELLRLRQALVETDARRRSTERARAELEAANEQLSQQVGEVQSLQAALQQQATQDFLTGLFNRRHLNAALPAMLALAQREGQPLALALIDLDHFKAVNDRHGHAAGDHLLSAFGQMLSRHSRRSDVACRYGGEEFCLLMPHTDARAAQHKLGNLLKQWSLAQFSFDTRQLGGQTFSAGVVDTLQGPLQMDLLLKAADDLLLLAKRRGRNQVATLESPSGPPSQALA